MNSKQRRTLDAIFETPTKSNINWVDILSLFEALGGEVSTGRGSRVRVALNGVKASFHRAHPGKEANKGTIESVAKFLVEAGVRNS